MSNVFFIQRIVHEIDLLIGAFGGRQFYFYGLLIFGSMAQLDADPIIVKEMDYFPYHFPMTLISTYPEMGGWVKPYMERLEWDGVQWQKE